MDSATCTWSEFHMGFNLKYFISGVGTRGPWPHSSISPPCVFIMQTLTLTTINIEKFEGLNFRVSR